MDESPKKIIQQKNKNAIPTDESKLEALIVSLDDLVFEIDKNGIFRDAWASDESRFFVPKSYFIGKNISDAIPGPLGKSLAESVENVLQYKNTKEIEYKSPIDNRYYIARVNIFKSSSGEERISVLIRDVTHRKQFELELLQAKNEAERALKIKSDFLSAISHEIRTPMNAILGFTNIILESPHDAETTEYLNSIKYASDNLLILINELLDFNKLESGVINFEQIDFDIHHEIQQLTSNFSMKAAQKGIYFKTKMAANIPKFLIGDPYRLYQALSNLLSNAVKFTYAGGVNFDIKVNKKEAGSISLLFTIRDSGIGIDESNHQNIFESFVQASASISREFGGTGLGLAIAKKIIDQQNGSIHLKSATGEGAVFTVELPFTISSHKTVSDAVLDKNQLDLSNFKVLIVEDNVMNQLVIKKTLEICKANCTIVNNGLKAVKILGKEHFDIVLMDLQMPEMDGLEATKIIRSRHSTALNKNIPIIALTANAFTESKVEALSAGMNDYIVKPFTKEELSNKILKQLQR